MNIKKLYSKKHQKKPFIFVGMPGDKAFTVHSNDATPDDVVLYTFYSTVEKRFKAVSEEVVKSNKPIYNMNESKLYRAVDIDGNEFIIPVHAGKYQQIMLDMIEQAQAGWIKRKPNNIPGMNGFEYGPYASEQSPKWSDKSFDELLDSAFEGHIVDSNQNTVVQEQFQEWGFDKA